MEPEVRLDKDSIDKVRLDKEIEDEPPAAARPRAHKKFTPPSLEEVAAYCTERGNTVDAQRFVDYYASKGWTVGKSPMKDMTVPASKVLPFIPLFYAGYAALLVLGHYIGKKKRDDEKAALW